MNKKFNTVLFLAAATLFNVVSCVIFFVLLFLVFDRVVAPRLDASARVWGLPVILFASLGLSLGAYQLAVRCFTRRVDMGRYFSSLFTPARRRNGED